MKEVAQSPKVESIEAASLELELQKVPMFAGTALEDLASLGAVELVHANPDEDLSDVVKSRRGLWVTLEGEVRVSGRDDDGTLTLFGVMGAGESFGEVPVLSGREARGVVTATEPSKLLYLKEETFWKLMDRCPQVREVVLRNMANRLQVYQSQALHKEKLIALGTLTAGLMHELNNPGAAARRAASQLRENLSRLQLISLRLCSGEPKTESQMECLRNLQQQALDPQKHAKMNSLDQSDAEERLAEWLECQGIENAWELAPTLTDIGLDEEKLSCAQQEFSGNSLSDPLNWVAGLTSSMQLVGTVEESVSRVTELVRAVKKYAYEDKKLHHELDIHDGLESTLIILGHKLRQKELTVVRRFAANLPQISTTGSGLNQVWTNLLDNAIDAAPQKGVITLSTQLEGSRVLVGVADNGPGIAEEHKAHIFEPFFTTKPAGEGTGLGLDIVHRIVVDQFGGEIQIDSVPGRTEFLVILPLRS
jgi:signal transduction histidine kinase